MSATRSAAIAVLLAAFVQHPESLLRKAQDNGGQVVQSLDVSSPVYRIPQLTQSSVLIVRGRVQSTTMALSSDETLVQTVHDVAVQRVLKGPASLETPGSALDRNIQVLIPGGSVTVNGLHMSTVVDEYPAAERLAVGEDVVLFLLKSEAGRNAFVLTAGPFGAFRVHDDGIRAMTRAAGRSRGDRPETVAAFLSRVTALVEKGPKDRN